MITNQLQQLQNAVYDWTGDTEAMLSARVPKKSGKLAGSIKGKVKNSRIGEPYAISFSFLRYGVWLEKGVYKGVGGAVGSYWEDKHGVKRRTDPRSLGKMVMKSQWYAPVIESRLPVLAGLIGMHLSSAIVKHIGIK